MRRIARWFLRKILPSEIWRLLKNFRILSRSHGQWQSIKNNSCIDADNNPIPWYTYPAIEFIKQFDLSQKRVFEYGLGNSSLFWAKRTKEVTSIESNKSWYDRINGLKLDNMRIVLAETKEGYVPAISKLEMKFDIIVIDGRYRLACARNAIKFLKDDGMIILDNSDWFPKTSEFIRNKNFIEIDFHGFGPINDYTWTTSLFLSREIQLSSLSRQPSSPIGALRKERVDEENNLESIFTIQSTSAPSIGVQSRLK